MQRFLALPVVDPPGAPAETIPAYVVPLEPVDGEAGATGTETPQAPDVPRSDAEPPTGAN
jgi:hypothetical protein